MAANPYEPPEQRSPRRRHPFSLTGSESFGNLLTWMGVGGLIGGIAQQIFDTPLGLIIVVPGCAVLAGIIGWSLDRPGE